VLATDGSWYRMINVGGLCGIITTNVERYAYAGFGFAFLICLCLIVASVTLFNIGYTKFGEWFMIVQQLHMCLHY
jgi:hypothetical protein